MRYRVWIIGRPETERVVNVPSGGAGRIDDERIRGHAIKTIYFSPSEYERLVYERELPK